MGWEMFTCKGYLFVPKKQEDFGKIMDIVMDTWGEDYLFGFFDLIPSLDQEKESKALAYCLNTISVAVKPSDGLFASGGGCYRTHVRQKHFCLSDDVFMKDEDKKNVKEVLDLLKESGIELREHGLGYYIIWDKCGEGDDYGI